MTPIPLRLLSLFALICLANVVRASDGAAPIRDDAKMLHTETIDRAEQGIADIRKNFDRNVFVRTVDTAPPHRWFPILRTPKINRMLDEQARSYADESGASGIYVVISKHPRDVRIHVRPEDDVEFTRRDAEALRRSLTWSLHERVADAVLLDLVDRVHDVLQEHRARGPSVVVSDVALGGVLGAGLGLWLLLRLIRYKMRSDWRAGSRQRLEKTSARSTAALSGAMFGCPAGAWIYDKLYPHPVAAAADGMGVSTAEPQPPPAEDRPWQGVGLG